MTIVYHRFREEKKNKSDKQGRREREERTGTFILMENVKRRMVPCGNIWKN
jgi:hypothetical protein